MSANGQNSKADEREQRLILTDRRELKLTGVKDVDRFSESEIILSTCDGKLQIRGEGLRISSVNVVSGDFSAEGKILSLVYSKGQKEPLFARLLK